MKEEHAFHEWDPSMPNANTQCIPRDFSLSQKVVKCETVDAMRLVEETETHVLVGLLLGYGEKVCQHTRDYLQSHSGWAQLTYPPPSPQQGQPPQRRQHRQQQHQQPGQRRHHHQSRRSGAGP